MVRRAMSAFKNGSEAISTSVTSQLCAYFQMLSRDYLWHRTETERNGGGARPISGIENSVNTVNQAN
ncbi:hypothetical protein TMatcc_004466 [Talaromyces marneffei ATCC 18224]